MENKKNDPHVTQMHDEQPAAVEDSAPTENEPVQEEEHAQGNYIFALKVLVVLAAIILILVILKLTGVRFSIKDLIPGWIGRFPLDLL